MQSALGPPSLPASPELAPLDDEELDDEELAPLDDDDDDDELDEELDPSPPPSLAAGAGVESDDEHARKPAKAKMEKEVVATRVLFRMSEKVPTPRRRAKFSPSVSAARNLPRSRPPSAPRRRGGASA